MSRGRAVAKFLRGSAKRTVSKFLRNLVARLSGRGARKFKTKPATRFHKKSVSNKQVPRQHCLMHESAPGKELQGIKAAESPFRLKALGGVQHIATDAWMMKDENMDGSCQVLEKLSVWKITTEFP